MCRMIEYQLEPVFREDEEGDLEDLEDTEDQGSSSVPSSTTSTSTTATTTPANSNSSSLPPFFVQDFINNDPQMAKLIIKRQLMLIIHANYCSKIDHLFPARPPCEMKNCQDFKGVLEHLSHCQRPLCDTPRCISSRNILRHYSSCYNINCGICF